MGRKPETIRAGLQQLRKEEEERRSDEMIQIEENIELLDHFLDAIDHLTAERAKKRKTGGGA